MSAITKEETDAIIKNADPEILRICKELKVSGKLQNAEVDFLAYVANKEKNLEASEAHHVIEAYSHLIRIAAELREFEKMAAYIEKVKNIPITCNADTIKFGWCLFSAGNGWLYSGNTARAKASFEKSLEIATELKDDNMIFSSKLNIIEVLRTDGYFNEVVEEVKKLRATLTPSSPIFYEGKILILEGSVLRKQGRYKEAIECLERSRSIFAANKNLGDYHYILWAIGTCYAALEDAEKAKIYLELAQNNADGIEFWRINILSNLTLAELCTVIGKYDDADMYYKRIVQSVGTDEMSYYGRRLIRGQTLLAIRKGDYANANELIDRLVIVAVREKNQRELMRLRLLKAEVLLRNGEAAEHEEARTMLQEAIAFYGDANLVRHQLVCLELLARLDSTSGYPTDSIKKVEDLLVLARTGQHDRWVIRALLAKLVLDRKLGRRMDEKVVDEAQGYIKRLNLQAEKVVLDRFLVPGYDAWAEELGKLDPNAQRYVNEFFEDFHFVPVQAIDIEIDQNTHYVREKHLGEIPFYNKFTLMRLLCLLAEKPGKEFSKEDLAKEIWGQEYNPLRHDNNIYININRLRKLIEPNPRENRYIMNGSRGYYFNPAMKVNISSKIASVSPRSLASVNKAGAVAESSGIS